MGKKASLPTITGLRPYQSSVIATQYLSSKDWKEVRAFVNKENLFDSSRSDTTKRYLSQIQKNMETLDDELIEVVANGSESDRLAVLWLGFCRAFPIIGKFVIDVICEKYRNRNYKLVPEDLWEFFADQGGEYDNLVDMSPAMRAKVKSVIFYDLRDACYIDENDEIVSANLSDYIKNMIREENLVFFPGEVL